MIAKRIFFYATLSFFLFLPQLSEAQSKQSQVILQDGQVAKRAIAKIMVIPRTNSDEDIRTVLDDSPINRTAISKIKEFLDQRGWSTTDFVSSLNAAKSKAAFSADKQQDFRSALLNDVEVDFFIEVDVQMTEHGSETMLTLTIEAKESHNGLSFSNKSASARFDTTDHLKLLEKAFSNIQEEFLNNITAKTDDILTNGRATYLEFSLSEEAGEMTYDDDLPIGQTLNDVIVEYVENNSLAHSQPDISDITCSFEEVRLPVYDEFNEGKPFSLNTYMANTIKHLKSKGIKAKRLKKGQKMFIYIQGLVNNEG